MTEIRDPEWYKRANCEAKGEDDPDALLFISSDWRDWKKAKEICSQCPVRRDCMIDALEHGDVFGVWGGVDQYELRRALGVDENSKPKAVPPNKLRCPYCFSYSLSTIEKKRVVVRLECNDCELRWWRRRVGILPAMKRENLSDGSNEVGNSVPASS